VTYVNKIRKNSRTFRNFKNA